jgi:hypothetical protein
MEIETSWKLSDALLEFSDAADLQQWLQTHEPV